MWYNQSKGGDCMQEQKDKAKELYTSGFGSLAKVAKALDVSKSTVDSWKNRDKKNGEDWVKIGAIKKVVACNQEEEIKKVAKVKKNKIKEIEDKLTEKQKLFAYYYIQSFNGTQSAIKAGYSPKGAFVEASRMLKNVKVKGLLDELREDFNHNIGLTTEMILNRHAKIAFSNMFDFVDGQRKLKPIDEIDGTLISDFAYTKEDTEFEGGSTSKTNIKLKVEDRKNSLNFLTKYAGLDKVEKDVKKEDNEIKVVGV